MRKLFILIVLSLFATTAFALVETASNGPQNVTACWIQSGPLYIEPGSLLALVSGSSVTFPGKEVTGCDTDTGYSTIYGVYIGPPVTWTSSTMAGNWIPVQTHGYVSTIALDGTSTAALDCRAGNVINSSTTAYEGTLRGVSSAGGAAFSAATTGNVMAFAQPVAGAGTVSAWIYGI